MKAKITSPSARALSERATTSIADIACYSELGPVSAKYGCLLDFAEFPNVQKWLERMSQVDCHDDVMLPNSIIGDLTNGVQPKVLSAANKEAIARWIALGSR